MMVVRCFDNMVKGTVVCKHMYSGINVVISISFTYNRNNKGPKTVPCGTPDITLTSSEATPFNTTFCVLWVSQILIHLYNNFDSGRLCGTVSKALLLLVGANWIILIWQFGELHYCCQIKMMPIDKIIDTSAPNIYDKINEILK